MAWSHLYTWSRVISNYAKRLMRVLLADTYTECSGSYLNSFLPVKIPLVCYKNFFTLTRSSCIASQMLGVPGPRRHISASPECMHCLLLGATTFLAPLLPKVELLPALWLKNWGEKAFPLCITCITRGKTQTCFRVALKENSSGW